MNGYRVLSQDHVAVGARPVDRFFYCLMLLTTTIFQAPAWADFATFAEHHCLACHGADAEPGLIRIDQLAAPAATSSDAQSWARIVEVLESGEMPPPDHARPDATEIRGAVEQIVSQIAATASPRKSALRRMNRREYENTVHDLLGIDVPLLDLLPEDGSSQGFDNVADGLSISSVLMEQYLEAANVAFDAVIRRIAPLPPAVRRAELMTVKENIDSVEKGKGGTIEVADSFVKFTPGWPPARLDAVHPIEDGIYRCRVALWPHDPSDRTLAVAIYVGSLFGPETRKFMGIYDVVGTPEKPRVIEFTTFIEEGHAIHIVPRIWPEHVTWRDKHEPRPGIGIMWAETYGPIDQSFPSEAQKALFGDRDSISMHPDQPIYMRHRKGVKTHVVESSRPVEDAERIIRDFIPRAFRRPVGEEEMAPFLRLTLAKLASGRTFEQAVRAGVTAVLCAPQFLLLNQAQQVDDYTLASRLSYFFWSSMPDAELLDLAASGQLSQPAMRHQQVERMLADPKSKAFIANFTGQWLDLREIEFTTPVGKLATVRKRGGRIDVRSLPIVFVAGNFFPFSQRAIKLAFSTNRVKHFQRKARGIDAAMTASTTGVITVFLQLLANRGRAADIGLHPGDSGRWWCGCAPQQVVQDPHAAQHG